MSNHRDRSAVALLETASSAHGVKPPPRNPRRLQQSGRINSTLSLSSSIREGPVSTAESDTFSTSEQDGNSSPMSTSSNFKLASHFTHERSALQDISPPSSPDIAAGDYSYLRDEVSPIDEYDDPQHSYYMTGTVPAHAPKSGHTNDAADSQYHSRSSFSWGPQTAFRHSFQSSKPRSHQMQLGSIGGSKKVAKNRAVSDDQNMENVSFHDKQMDVNSPGETRRASFRLVPGTEQPAKHGNSPYVAPLSISKKSSKRESQFENSQIISSRQPAPEIPEFPKVPSSVTETSDANFQPSKMWRGPIMLSKPLPEPRHLQDTPDSIVGGQNSQHDDSTLPSIGPAQRSATFSAQSLFGRLSPNQANAIKRKPPPPAQRQGSHSPSPSLLRLNTPRRASASVILPSFEQTRGPDIDSAWKRPASRFSAIPYATMNAETSLQPNINDVPANPPQSTPFMNRNSSVPNHDEIESTLMSLVSSQEMTTEKQTTTSSEFGQDEGMETPTHSRSGSQAHVRPVSVMSIDKPLPLAPPEISSVDDRIAHLNAVLSGLAHRRINTIKSIQQMTELIPSDNLMRRSDVVKKREMEKKKVEGLKEELYEIQRQEHELGLKLHRAYKRLEREDAFEPTSLWVRRKAGGE